MANGVGRTGASSGRAALGGGRYECEGGSVRKKAAFPSESGLFISPRGENSQMRVALADMFRKDGQALFIDFSEAALNRDDFRR